MSQTKAGAAKAKATLLAKDPDYYKRIGKKGGEAIGAPKGFATMSPEKVSAAGRKGSTVSRRGTVLVLPLKPIEKKPFNIFHLFHLFGNRS